MKTAVKETINLPRKTVEQLLGAISIFGSIQDEIEDFLIVRNKSLVAKIRKARKEHLRGEVKDFQKLARRYV